MKVFLDADLLIYLNTTPMEKRGRYDDLYVELAANNRLFTDVLVLVELLYISSKRYNVPYPVTEKFIDDVVLPYAEVFPLGLNEYRASIEAMKEIHLRLSDALHVASMRLNGVATIASEDRGLDATSNIGRIWITDSSTTKP